MKTRKTRKVGSNIDKPVLKVKYAELERSGESLYRSECPVCKDGILLMRRDEKGKLLKTDYCVFCGQGFIYTDLKKSKLI